jgi:hypothetical protein
MALTDVRDYKVDRSAGEGERPGAHRALDGASELRGATDEVTPHRLGLVVVGMGRGRRVVEEREVEADGRLRIAPSGQPDDTAAT